MTAASSPFALLCAIAFAAVTAPASAQEVFVGGYAHGVDTPLTLETGERGADIEAGVRFDRIEALSFIGKPEPYVFGSLSTSGETSFVAAGLSWTLGKGRFYARPGIGVAVHDGPALRVNSATTERTDLGSRVVFAPEVAVGVRLSGGWSAEASWVHLSHARIFSGQNPGLDRIGIRLNHRLR